MRLRIRNHPGSVPILPGWLRRRVPLGRCRRARAAIVPAAVLQQDTTRLRLVRTTRDTTGGRLVLDPSRDRHDIAQAAARLGISQDGVRKRIKRGQLAAYRVDGRTYVVLDGETDQRNSLNGHAAARQDGPDSRPDNT